MRCAWATLCLLVIASVCGEDLNATELPNCSLHYQIDIRLDPSARGISGTERITFRNPGEQPISTVPVHLTLNAFSHDATTWMEGAAIARFDPDTLLSRYGDDIWGGIRLVSVGRADGETQVALPWSWARPDDHNPFDFSLASVVLDAPLAPGDTVELAVVFEARLPIPIARTGVIDDFALVSQAFPKLAVREIKGVRHAAVERWVAHQFHGPTEFYSEYADYDVTLDIPSGWEVAATGSRSADSTPSHAHYRAAAVGDFAFAVGRNLSVHTQDHEMPDGRSVAVSVVTPAGLDGQGERIGVAVRAALDVLVSRVGPYPYATLTVVLPPFSAHRTSGMEYPTFITGLPADPIWDLFGDLRLPELVAIHELAHQYFYGVIGTNEQEEALLDEGFTSYWEAEIMESLYGPDAGGAVAGRTLSHLEARRRALALRGGSIHEAISKRPSFLFYPGTSTLQIYARPALTLRTAAALYGRDRLDQVFASYYRRYAFGHPDLQDFLEVAGEVGGRDLRAFMDEAFNVRESPDYAVARIDSHPYVGPRGGDFLGAAVVATALDARLEQMRDRPDGAVRAEVVDPGYGDHDGRVELRTLPAVAVGSPAPGVDVESEVLLTGPGWKHLPVQVDFVFSDGRRVSETWDGRASWRRYRFIRRAALVSCELDRRQAVAVDANRINNGVRTKADELLSDDWALWSAAVAQWIAVGASLWL